MWRIPSQVVLNWFKLTPANNLRILHFISFKLTSIVFYNINIGYEGKICMRSFQIKDILLLSQDIK